jgi:phosphate transport system substrate-binding protein
MLRKFMLAGIGCLGAFAFFEPANAESISLGGTGAATELLRRLGSEFASRSGVEVKIVPSLGSSGGIRAVADGALDIAVSARPLKPEESTKGLKVALTLRTPFVFATSLQNPPGMTVAEIVKAFSSEKPVWPDGTAIRIILRPKSEADVTLMGNLFPGLAEAIELARRRLEIAVAATDQDNADLAERTPGSLIGTSYLQVMLEKRALRLITIDGAEPTLENFERGIYPYGKTLDFIVSAQTKPAVKDFLDFVRSPEGNRLHRPVHSF